MKPYTHTEYKFFFQEKWILNGRFKEVRQTEREKESQSQIYSVLIIPPHLGAARYNELQVTVTVIH